MSLRISQSGYDLSKWKDNVPMHDQLANKGRDLAQQVAN